MANSTTGRGKATTIPVWDKSRQRGRSGKGGRGNKGCKGRYGQKGGGGGGGKQKGANSTKPGTPVPPAAEENAKLKGGGWMGPCSNLIFLSFYLDVFMMLSYALLMITLGCNFLSEIVFILESLKVIISLVIQSHGSSIFRW